MMPQVVEPAHPPINIIRKNKGFANGPQLLKSVVTYPVPVIIDITVTQACLMANDRSYWLVDQSQTTTKNIRTRTIIEKD